jgi:hypothetical protein
MIIAKIQTDLSISFKDNNCLHSRPMNINFLWFYVILILYSKGKRAPVLRPCYEDVLRNRRMAPFINRLSIRGKKKASFTPRYFNPEKISPCYPLAWSQSSPGHCVRREKYLPLLEIET